MANLLRVDTNALLLYIVKVYISLVASTIIRREKASLVILFSSVQSSLVFIVAYYLFTSILNFFCFVSH
jgi:hypothetical protein